jgi:CDP-glucose 4,6-dehydratase
VKFLRLESNCWRTPTRFILLTICQRGAILAIDLFDNIYSGKNILVTGNTGFKGSWLSLWLKELGANVLGYSLSDLPNTSHYKLTRPRETIYGDILDFETFQKTLNDFQPAAIFHLAAQSLVVDSYNNPRHTYEVNVVGSLNVLEAARTCPCINAIVNVTSDKCYANVLRVNGYQETDRLGGYDPYSSSKACSEIMTDSFRNSFFNLDEFGSKHNCLIATTRAGNVIGGGDWAKYRIVPDIIRSKWGAETLSLRSPNATRPWQHVLEPLSGYLKLAQKLLEGQIEFASAWNFGPPQECVKTVAELVTGLEEHIGSLDVEMEAGEHHEDELLLLDSRKARERLGWQSTWTFDQTIEAVGKWYHSFYETDKVISLDQLREFTRATTS